MKTLSPAAALVVLAVSASSAFAGLSTGYKLFGTEQEWSTVVPIRPNASGKPSCPSNFVMRGKVCLSIFADRSALHYSVGDREMVRPRIIRRGQFQCPSNFIVYRKTCISLYY
jgi:hypothetical protein